MFSEIRDSKIGVLLREFHTVAGIESRRRNIIPKLLHDTRRGDSRQVEKIPLMRTVRKNKLRWYATGRWANIFLGGEYGANIFLSGEYEANIYVSGEYGQAIGRRQPWQ